jgi:hypothetical protein
MWLKQGKLIGDYAHRESARSSVEGQNALLGMLRHPEAIWLGFGVQKAVNEVACERDNQRHRPHDWQTRAWNKPQPARQ